jgi:phosphoribosylformylglycinamidine synthase
MSLEEQEIEHLKNSIGRTPTSTELQIVAAEWSEHCSYKSSKKHLKLLPMNGPRVIKEQGYDSGVLDVGDGYVVTVHIESHNHPSAVEPYGGAATGVGGVIRDILSAGTRPIALLDGLRFGDIEKDPHARWLFKNAVTGIADYGNCLGIPTIGGEIEFDKCYTNYALVDVAAIGFGKKDRLIKNMASPGDLVVLIGGHTGRDGIGGSQFASDSLESQDRSAVQIPDPFIEKLIIEAIIEARNQKLIHAMKDLGGGGLSCAISETADALGVGIDMDVNGVHVREKNMHPNEIMTSESQERMLIVTSKTKLEKLDNICKKFRIKCSVIGTIKQNKTMHVRSGDSIIADIPTEIVANAPLLDRPAKKPEYLSHIQPHYNNKETNNHTTIKDIPNIILKLLKNPNIASKRWAYNQYDYEVGIRTVVKPGLDAASLRLDNGKFLSVKIDGNPKQCYIDPMEGSIGVFEEACRNVVCTGGKPIGMVDHLQFANPEDPEIFWTFLESLKGISKFAKEFDIPCVGGKVSFYNETPDGPIKPTPIIGILGLSDKAPNPYVAISPNDILVIIGNTKDELGGSEYLEYIHKFVGGKCPKVNFEDSKRNMNCTLNLINKGLVKYAHDCSKGGIAIAISEICMSKNIGCQIQVNDIPTDIIQADENNQSGIDKILFSESHSRYLLVIKEDNLEKIIQVLSLDHNITYAVIGKFTDDEISFEYDDHNVKHKKEMAKLRVDKAQKIWLNSLEELATHG